MDSKLCGLILILTYFSPPYCQVGILVIFTMERLRLSPPHSNFPVWLCLALAQPFMPPRQRCFPELPTWAYSPFPRLPKVFTPSVITGTSHSLSCSLCTSAPQVLNAELGTPHKAVQMLCACTRGFSWEEGLGRQVVRGVCSPLVSETVH